MIRSVVVPGDKSLSHRALLFAALAEGESRLSGLLDSADVRATANALRACGIDVPEFGAGRPIQLQGAGLAGLRTPTDTLDCGNSGTTARLLLGVLAGAKIVATLDGDASLRGRPMRRVTEPLSTAGARFTELGVPDRLPLRVEGGALHDVRYTSPHASAQVKSALLLAGLAAGVRVEVSEPSRSRDHTERLLAAQGVDIVTTQDDAGFHVQLRPAARLTPLDFDVPGDISSAVFIAVFGVLQRAGEVRIENVGLNPGRTGALAVLERMGAHIELDDRTERCGEPVGGLRVASARRLRATTVQGREVPSLIDEIPALAIAAARADGVTRIRGAAELRVKESDRIAALVDNLRAVGVHAEAYDDGLAVTGGEGPLAGRVETRGDHRIAMAFGVLGALPGNRIEIDDPGVVDVSFPDFWRTLAACTEGAE